MGDPQGPLRLHAAHRGWSRAAHDVGDLPRGHPDRLGALHRRVAQRPTAAVQGRDAASRPDSHPQAGEQVVAHLSGSARTLPARGSWSFHPDGPLGWLAGKHSLGSARMADFAMSFG